MLIWARIHNWDTQETEHEEKNFFSDWTYKKCWTLKRISIINPAPNIKNTSGVVICLLLDGKALLPD